MVQNKLKMGSFQLFMQPKWSGITFGKTHFLPIFDPCSVPKRRIFKAFWDFQQAKTRHHGLKTG